VGHSHEVEPGIGLKGTLFPGELPESVAASPQTTE